MRHTMMSLVAAAAAVALVGCSGEPTLDDELGPADDEAADDAVEDDDGGDGEVEQVVEEDLEPEPAPEEEAVAAYQAFLDAQVVAANGDEGPLAALTTEQLVEVLAEPSVDEDGELQAVIGRRTADPVSVEVGDDGTVLIEDCQIDRRRFVPLHEAGAEVPDEFRGRWTTAQAQLEPSDEGWQVVRYGETLVEVEAGNEFQPLACVPPTIEQRLVEFTNDYYDARWHRAATGEFDLLEPLVTDQHYRWHQNWHEEYGAYNRVRGEGGSEVMSGNPNIARVRYCFDTTEYDDVDRDTGETLVQRGEGWDGVDVAVVLWTDTEFRVDGGVNVQRQGEECHDTRQRTLNTFDN